MKNICFTEIKNAHKYIEKSDSFDGEINPSSNTANYMNFSRSLSNSGNWIGCGYMTKSDNHLIYENILFPFYSLVIVVQGTGLFVDQDGNRHKLAPGSIFQRVPEQPHSSYVDSGSGWREYYFDCDKNLYLHLCSLAIIDDTKLVHSIALEPLLLNKIDVILNLFGSTSHCDLPDLYLEYLSILRSLFSESVAREGQISSDVMVDTACLDFQPRYNERFSLKDYCIEKGWGYDTFRKRFKVQMGLSPLEYLVQKRMEEACQQLRSSAKQVAVIASELGYASPYEFSNQFKKHFGVYPKHFRDGKKTILSTK